MEKSHRIPVALSTERDIQIVHGNKKTINHLMEGSIPDAVKTEKAIRNSHGNPVMGMIIPVAHNTEMEIQSGHGLPDFESIIPVAMKTEMEIQKAHEEHPVQNHPVLSAIMIPQAQDTEKEIADIQQQVMEEERNALGALLDGLPDGDPGLSRGFLEDANEVDASFLKALEKGSSEGMDDPGREVEDAVHRLYENQEFVGGDEEVPATQPTRLHLFNSSDLVLMDFMVKQLKTQPGMRMTDKEESERMSVPEPADRLTLTHEQLENLQRGQEISLDRTENEKEQTKTKQNTSVKKGDKVKIMMTAKNVLMLSHDQLKNLKKQQEVSEAKEDSKVTTASSEDPDMFEMSPSQISIPKVTTKETTNIFSPTLIPSMADKKSRKRKFKNRLPSSSLGKSKPDVESPKPKASKEHKLNLRRLFRNRNRTPAQPEPKKKETLKDAVQKNYRATKDNNRREV